METQAWECYFWGTLTVLSLSQCLYLGRLRIEHDLDHKRYKAARISELDPSELSVQPLICSISCLASSANGPRRRGGNLENWIHRIATLCPLGCVSESVWVLLLCGPRGHMARRHARAKTVLMNATQRQAGPDTAKGAEERLQHNSWLIQSTQLHSCGHFLFYCFLV